jgi:DNA-binding MarR family transcriptional regulator
MTDEFTPLERAAWGGFMLLYGRMMRLIDDDLQSNFQITHPEFEVLLRLTWEPSHRLRIQDLAARSILSRSGISRVVERLEKAGFVTREQAPEDKRGFYAVLTPAGLARLKAAEQAHIAFVRAHFLSHFDSAELEQMAAFWGRMGAEHGHGE